MGVTITHPLPPLKEGRAGRRSAVVGNTGSHLMIEIIYGIEPANVHLRNVSPSLGGGGGRWEISLNTGENSSDLFF
jgi:hypothetical protein